MVVNLKYHDAFLLQSTVGVPALYQFRANSAFDPNITAIGHQPRGLDQWFTLYNRARVIKSTIEVKFGVVPATGVPQMLVLNTNTSTSAGSLTDLMEDSRSKSLMLSDSDSGPACGTLKAVCYPLANNRQYSDDNTFTGTADCQEQVIYTVQSQPVLGSTETICNASATIVYTIEFWDQRLPSGS